MRYRAAIGLLLSLLLLAGVIFAYVRWQGEVSRMSARLEGLAAEVAARAGGETGVARTDAALAEDEAALREFFLEEADIVSFTETLKERGRSLGSSVEVVSASVERGTPRGRILVSVRIRGTYDAVLRTLGAIEYGPQDARTERAVQSFESENWVATASFSFATARGL
jgi:hypothetical protein